MQPSRPEFLNSRSVVEQNVQRAASACCPPNCCCTPDKKSLSGCLGIESVVSIPRAAAHFSHRCSSVTESFSMCVTLTTPSRSLHTSHSIRQRLLELPYQPVFRPRATTRGPRVPPTIGYESRRPSRSRGREPA